MKALFPILLSAALLAACQSAPPKPASPPAAAGPNDTHAVMFEYEYDNVAQVFTHAQVIGGFAAAKKCHDSFGKAAVMRMGKLDENVKMTFFCIHKDAAGHSQVDQSR